MRLSPEQEAEEAAERREAEKSDKPNDGLLYVNYHRSQAQVVSGSGSVLPRRTD